MSRLRIVLLACALSGCSVVTHHGTLTADECYTFESAVNFQQVTGRACKQPDGEWRIVP